MANDTKKQPSDKKVQSTKRRGVLKSIGGSAAAVAAAQGLPDNWKKPLVDSIVLPSHAQTTITADSGSAGGDNVVTTAGTTAATTTAYVTTSRYIFHTTCPC